MPIVWVCVDCIENVELNMHGYCANCGSDDIHIDLIQTEPQGRTDDTRGPNPSVYPPQR